MSNESEELLKAVDIIEDAISSFGELDIEKIANLADHWRQESFRGDIHAQLELYDSGSEIKCEADGDFISDLFNVLKEPIEESIKQEQQ